MTDRSTLAWTLRPAGPGLEAILATIWATTFHDAYSSVHAPDDIDAYCQATYSLERAAQVLSDPRCLCKLAYRNEVPCGLYVLRQNECPIALPGEAAELKQLYVSASEYGSGLGHVLMEDALKIARTAGSSILWLTVADTNRRAQAFYHKYAFKPLGTGPVLTVGRQMLTSTVLAVDLRDPSRS